ncbi:hypothetical protein BOTBODRAFT_169375 [Botryobasidium botryosum FD-172 SS1]|uniref:Mitochondrial import inner membrane translocase subunit Tim21 n=1 Tax=Botryobasidium botryosum (strain FD-172 SS1) TaxID=930990 RepID=A0A067NA24_BOTB1|nr:hypothetical protein BOTBODRAFT_169375 [Botryobasidium botryosum FD-172 SS1]
MSAIVRLRLSCARTPAALAAPRLSRFHRTNAPRTLARSFATHRDPYQTSSLLSQELDRLAARKGSNSSSEPTDSVGPFQLGMSSRSRANDPKFKKWDDLTAGGKVLRTTARTSNLTVILLGAGFSAVLAWALATELFAKNSPTVLYSDACERIKSSPVVTAHLPGSLSFQTTAPSPLAPRHRNRHVQSHLALDSAGVEHLLLHFYVTSSPVAPPSTSWFEGWEWEWEWYDVERYARHKARETWDAARKAVAYISGTPLPPTASTTQVPTPATRVAEQKQSTEGWSLLGMFKGLKGGKGKGKDEVGVARVNGVVGDCGEVHVDFVKDPVSGEFKYRYLLLDIPSSKVRNPYRIFVERGEGFREGDGIVMWG